LLGYRQRAVHSHHGHSHDLAPGASRHAGGGDDAALARRRTRALAFALAANGLFLLLEVVGGFVFGSLALLADGAHMVSDVVALAIALIAQVLSRRPPTERHTFGLGRAEVLAAQVNGLLLFAGAIAVIVEAGRRFASPEPIDAGPVLAIGAVGLLINVVSAYAIARDARHNLNLRAAVWHLASDALGSVAVVVAAAGVLIADLDWLDPAASVLIGALVVVAAWQLLRGTTRVLLEGTPAGIDLAAVRDALGSQPSVEAVHHVHIWSLASETPALSAHVVLGGEEWTLHDAQHEMDRLKDLLRDRFGITHATLEVECHACDAEREHA
jgi:cobalt-zinc-cadmium efflux system protein